MAHGLTRHPQVNFDGKSLSSNEVQSINDLPAEAKAKEWMTVLVLIGKVLVCPLGGKDGEP